MPKHNEKKTSTEDLLDFVLEIFPVFLLIILMLLLILQVAVISVMAYRFIFE